MMIEALSIIICLQLIYLLLLVFGFWLRHESRFDEPADAAIVMGSFPMKALPRVQKAAQLYHQGLVRKLILSGKPLNGTLTEARWMFHRIGWRYTWLTVSRLIKYRWKGDL